MYILSKKPRITQKVVKLISIVVPNNNLVQNIMLS